MLDGSGAFSDSLTGDTGNAAGGGELPGQDLHARGYTVGDDDHRSAHDDHGSAHDDHGDHKSAPRRPRVRPRRQRIRLRRTDPPTTTTDPPTTTTDPTTSDPATSNVWCFKQGYARGQQPSALLRVLRKRHVIQRGELYRHLSERT